MRERKYGLALGAGGNNCVYGAGAAMELEEDIPGGHFVKLADYLPSGIVDSHIMALLKRCGVPKPKKALQM